MTNIMVEEREGPTTTPKSRLPPGNVIPTENAQKCNSYTTPLLASVRADNASDITATATASVVVVKSDEEMEEPQQQKQQQSSQQPSVQCHRERIKLPEVNSYLTCLLCKGYLIDATTISECLHSFCRSCIIKFLQDNSHCPVCEVVINKTKPNLKLDKTLQDIVYKLVPELYLNEMNRRRQFYANHPQKTSQLSPEQRGDDTERIIFNARDKFSLSLEYISDDSTPGAIIFPGKKDEHGASATKEAENMMRRFLQCPGMCRIDVLKKFVRNKYSVDTSSFHIDILYKRVPLPDHYTLIDIAYIYSWKRNEPMKFFFRITDIQHVRDRFDYYDQEAPMPLPSPSPLPPVKVKVELKTPASVISATEQPPRNQVEIKEDLTPLKKTKTVRFSSESPVISPAIVPKVTSDKDDSVANDQQLIKKPVSHVMKNGVNCKLNEVKPVKTPPVKKLRVSFKNESDNAAKKSASKLCVNGRKDIFKPIHKLPVKIDLLPLIPAMVNRDKKLEIPVPEVRSAHELEKEQFFRLIQLQARTNTTDITKPPPPPAAAKVNQRSTPTNLSPPAPKQQKSPKSESKAQKRKLNNPQRNVTTSSSPKKAKISPKLKKSAPKEAIKPSKLSAKTANSTSISKTSLPEVKNIKIESEPDLKNLLNTCKIPSSLSITCVNGDRETQIKPVINHIEILKLPEVPASDAKANADPTKDVSPAEHKKKPADLEKLGTTMKLQTTDDVKSEKPLLKEKDKSEVSITITMEKSKEEAPKQPVGVHLNLPKMLQPNPVSIRPLNSFQKIFEDTLKKRNAAKALGEAEALAKTEDKINKKSILDIATQLHKKTKFDHHPMVNAEGKVAIPRLKKSNTQCETISNLHSNALALNYSVSVNQAKPVEMTKAAAVVRAVEKPQKEESIVTSTTKADLPGVTTTPIAHKPPPASKLQELKVSVSPVPSPKMASSPDVKVTSSVPSPIPLKPKLAAKPAGSPVPKPVFNIKSGNAKAAKPKPTQSPLKVITPKPPIMPMEAMTYNQLMSKTISPPLQRFCAPLQTTPGKPPSKKISSKLNNNIPPNKPQLQPKLDVNQLQEKYNLQNLAQLSASFNFPAAFGQTPALNAIHHAMLMNLGMQNHNNWLAMNMTPANMKQYEKYLQTITGQPVAAKPAAKGATANGQSHLLTKEN